MTQDRAEIVEPEPKGCPYCDFGSGTRGMDRCGKCAGTGSGFFVNGAFYPNTKAGFDAAILALKEKNDAEQG